MRETMNDEQLKAWQRYIKAFKRVGFNKIHKDGHVPKSEILKTVDVDSLNHPMFEPNPLWLEYVEAVTEWLKVEPPFRKSERMSAIKGDYGDCDDWEEEPQKIKDSYAKLKD